MNTAPTRFDEQTATPERRIGLSPDVTVFEPDRNK
ncbi:MAG: hypothetical protein ACI9MC_001639 [Kiritimatiellia bacterium]|jgi:hypothetical protein